MGTKTEKIWRQQGEERRGEGRVSADFYAVELDKGARYLRRVTNVSVSGEGLQIENPLGDEVPGQTLELELPSKDEGTLHVQAEVVHTTADGHIGVRVTSEPLDVRDLGGKVPL
jgi:hypothetical protein